MTTTNDPSRGNDPQTPPAVDDPSKGWLTQTALPQSSSSSTSPSTDTAAAVAAAQPPKRPRIADAAQSIKPADFLTVHQAPCARQGFMTGIGGGVAMMGLRWVIGSPVMKAANWGVGTFVATSMMGWEYCRFQRRKEFEKMKRVVEVYDQRQAELAREKKKRDEEEARKRLQEEEEEGKRKKGGWKFW